MINIGTLDMSITGRAATLILAFRLLSFAGFGCGPKTEELRQLAAEQLEIAAKKLSADATPAPQAAEKDKGNSSEISVPKDLFEYPLSDPSRPSTEVLEKSNDGTITISEPKDSPGNPQQIPSHDLPDSTDKGDAPQTAPSTGVKTTTVKDEAGQDNTSTGGKQTVTATTLQIPRIMVLPIGHPLRKIFSWRSTSHMCQSGLQWE